MKHISYLNTGIEIDARDSDLSANVHNGMIEIAIGEDYQDAGYTTYLDFTLTVDEAIAFRDWLTKSIEGLST